jgi:hypothetical protein
MNKVIERATSHFRTKLSAEMQSVYVPEWDAKVFFKTTITLKEQSKLIELASAGKQVEALCESLIVKARNEDGTKMFGSADKIILMNEVDPAVIIRIVGEINELTNDTPDTETAEKN